MRTDINKINEHTPHTGLTEGMQVFAAGTSKYFKTGEWRNNTPVYLEDNCKQCLLCAPVCPDSSIPVKDQKRGAFVAKPITRLGSGGSPLYILLEKEKYRGRRICKRCNNERKKALVVIWNTLDIY